MKAILKTLFLLFVTAVCLTSDTASSVTQVQSSNFKVQKSAKRSLMNCVAYAATGQRLQDWDCQRLDLEPETWNVELAESSTPVIP